MNEAELELSRGSMIFGNPLPALFDAESLVFLALEHGWPRDASQGFIAHVVIDATETFQRPFSGLRLAFTRITYCP
jgi:hypothetical protein